MKTCTILALAALLAVLPALRAADTAPESAAAAALVWLQTVDEKKYDASWDAAAEYFKNAVSSEDWQKAMRTYREPLGDLVKRALKNADHKTSLPGTPDGEYFVIQFETEFSQKKQAVETITMLLGPDRIWRTSGYFIK